MSGLLSRREVGEIAHSVLRDPDLLRDFSRQDAAAFVEAAFADRGWTDLVVSGEGEPTAEEVRRHDALR